MTEHEKTIKLLKAFHEMDLLNKPFALFIHPEDYTTLMKHQDLVPGALDRYEIIQDDAMEKGGIVIINRKEMESWLRPSLKGDKT